MALHVGELYATMRLDDAQFNQGLDGSQRRFDRLRSAVSTGVKTLAVGFAAATSAAGALAVSAARVGVEYNSLRQTGMAALTTLTGSAEGAVEQMAKLDEFGRTSWVMRDVLIQAQTQMMGFGIETEKVIPYLDALQEGVAAVGGSNQDFAELATIMAQIEGQSKITAEELRMFGMRGIDAAGLIGEAMGKTGGEIREMISAGALDATDALDALAESMQTKFEGATENVRATWDGATANMAGAWRDFGAALVEPFVDPTGGGYAVVWVNDLANAVWDLEAKTRPFVALLVDRFQPGIDAISPALQEMAGVINSWDLSQVNRQLDELTQYAPLIAGVATAMFSLGTQSVPILRSINPLVAGFAALAATSPEVRTMLSEFASSLSPLLPVMGDFAVLLADTALLVLSELTPALSDLLVAGGDLASTLGMALVPAVGDLLVAAAPLVGVLADVVSWVADLPGPVQAAFLAFLALQGPLSPVVAGLQGVAEGFVRIIQQAQVQAALGDTNVLMGGLASASARASAGVSGLSTALRTAFISSGIGIAIAGITAALSAFITSQAEARRKADEYRDSLDQVTASITEQTRELAFNNLEQAGAIEKAKDLGISLQDLVDAAVDPTSDAYARLQEMGQQANDELSRAQEDGPQNVAAIKAVADENEDLWDVLRAVGIEQAVVGNEQDALRDKIAAGIGTTQEATDATNEYRLAQEALRDELNEGADVTLSAAEAALRYEDATSRTRDAIDRKAEAEAEATRLAEDANATDEDRQRAAREVERATSAVEQAILAEVRALENDLEAKARNNATSSELYEVMRQGRDSFIEQRIAMGDSREEAEALADSYGLIPEDVHTRFNLYGVEDAQRTIDRFIDRNGNRQVSITLNTRQGTVTHFPGPGGGISALADGGLWDGTVRAFANGGIDHAGRHVARVPQIVQGGRNILWGEPETGWESYISGKPSARARNLAVMDETARRLGGFFVRPMAEGGTTGTTGTAPRPAPVAAPVSLDGAHITGTFRLEEDGFVRIVDGRIEQRDSRDARRARMAGVS